MMTRKAKKVLRYKIFKIILCYCVLDPVKGAQKRKRNKEDDMEVEENGKKISKKSKSKETDDSVLEVSESETLPPIYPYISLKTR
jgi:hypothetical protein